MFLFKDYLLFFLILEQKIGVFHKCQVQVFFEILELKFTFVNEHFKISKVTKKLALVKNARKFNKNI